MTARATAWTRRGPLPRPAVDRALDGTAPIVALVAPAGFGKTVALRSLAQRHDPATIVHTATDPDVIDELRSANSGRGTVLLDDAHLLDAERTSELTDIAREVAAGGGRLVLASRTSLDLPLRRWQVEGTAEVVTSRGLAFDRATLAAALDLDEQGTELAIESTQGWPSAVALVARHQGDLPLWDALAAAQGDHVAYVAEEALSVLDAHELDLLTRVSVLDRLDAATASQVVGDPRASTVLWEVAERTQLLEPARHGHLSWRTDVRAALERELVRTRPTAVPGLHLTAAAALGNDRRQVAARLRHLVAAEAWDLTVGLIATHWREMVDPDRYDVLTEAALAVPLEVVAPDPVLTLGGGAILVVSGRFIEAETYFESPTVQANPAAAATASALRAHATWWSTPPGHALDRLDDVTRLLEREPGRELLAVPGFEPITTGRSMLVVSRARALALTGDVQQAAALLSMLTTLPASDPVASSVSAWATKAWVDAMAGSLVDATAATDMAFTLGHQGDWSGTANMGPAYLARALITARSGTSTDTWDDVANAAETAIRFRAWGLLRTTQAVAAMCGHVDRRLPLPTPGPGVRFDGVVAHVPLAERILAAWQARHALRTGDTQRAAAISSTTTPSHLALCPWVETSLALHGAERTAATLAEVPAPTTPAGHIERLLADAAVTDDAAARDELLRRAIAQASSGGLEGLLRHHPGSIDDLHAASGDERLIALLSSSPADQGLAALSERELEILALLDGPLTINEIGPEVYLSAHTAKWYVTRIYRKLGVHSRAEATARAHQLGLLAPPA